ncbi:Uncharacterized protein HZ326_31522 [Fusarium oxysporum f. sp. albedinis]|nr:Uncharacterized protein HZ326_31522 [Fusarium oxysporum f. sp. albedinis]
MRYLRYVVAPSETPHGRPARPVPCETIASYGTPCMPFMHQTHLSLQGTHTFELRINHLVNLSQPSHDDHLYLHFCLALSAEHRRYHLILITRAIRK